MSKFSRSDIKRFFSETINSSFLNESTIDIAGMNISYDASGIIIGDKKFSLTALTFFDDYPLSIKSIEQGEKGSLLITASTKIKDVVKPLFPEKLNQIKKAIESGQKEFVISGKLADVKFKQIRS